MSASGIIAYLLNRDDNVLALIPAKKQFLDEAEQGVAPPYIIISDIGGFDGSHLRGQDQYPRDRVQVDCIDKTSSGVRYLCRLVNAALIDTIKIRIETPGDMGLKVKDVDILEAGRPHSLYADSREMKIVSQDYYVRWRYI